jgi:hypothetical protein
MTDLAEILTALFEFVALAIGLTIIASLSGFILFGPLVFLWELTPWGRPR